MACSCHHVGNSQEPASWIGGLDGSRLLDDGSDVAQAIKANPKHPDLRMVEAGQWPS